MLLQLALGAALLAAPAQDSVRVQASLSAARVSAGETAVLLISVETDGAAPAEIPVPVLPPGLDLGPISDFSQVQIAFPGGRRRVTRREIVVLAREPGQYRIPSVVVEVGGRRQPTPALELIVLPGLGPAARPDAGDEVRLRAWIEPESVYVGQQLLYQAEALFPEELRLRQARNPVFEPPATTGFWVFDLPDAVSVSLRIVGGSAVEVQNFKQVLFPLSPGSFTLPPSRMLYEIRQGVVFTPVRRESASEPVTVEVRPLPPGAPAPFAGAVGRYRVSAALVPERVGPGEPATLRLTVEGAGNVKALARPELPPIAGADVYVGAERVQVGFADGLVSGRKVMEWTVVPRDPGRIDIAPLAYAWFDPQLGTYQESRTDTLQLTAAAGASTAGDSALAPLRVRSDLVLLGWTRSGAFLAAQLLPPLLLALFLLLRQRAGRRAQASAAEGRAGLTRAAALLDRPRACLDELAAYVRELDTPPARVLLERIRHLRYRPEPPTPAECEALLQAARRLGGGGSAHGHSLPLLLLAALTLPAAPEPTAFADGVLAYGVGEYDVAARTFADHLRAEPRDAAAWYDLGNAWVQRDETGRAAWAWLRALELRPRDAWARHNLARSGAAHALDDLAPAVRLSTEELALAAALCWWVFVFAAAAAWRRRRPARLALAGVSLALLLAAGAVLAARGMRPPRAVTLVPTHLRAAPVLRADTLAQLGPAAPLLLLDARGDWVLARARDLREGWVERRSVGRL